MPSYYDVRSRLEERSARETVLLTGCVVSATRDSDNYIHKLVLRMELFFHLND